MYVVEEVGERDMGEMAVASIVSMASARYGYGYDSCLFSLSLLLLLSYSIIRFHIRNTTMDVNI